MNIANGFWGGGREGGFGCYQIQGTYVCNKTSLIASRDMNRYGEDCYLLGAFVWRQQAGELRERLMEQFLRWFTALLGQ